MGKINVNSVKSFPRNQYKLQQIKKETQQTVYQKM